MNIQSWKLDEIVGREDYEALVERLGGELLARCLDEERRARLDLQAVLEGGARDRLITYADASVDVATTREDAAARAGLCYGVALGAALARFPDDPSEAVLGVAARAACAVLAGDLGAPTAGRVVSTVVETLAGVTEL